MFVGTKLHLKLGKKHRGAISGVMTVFCLLKGDGIMGISKTKNASFKATKMVSGVRYYKTFPTKEQAEDWLELLTHHSKENTLGKVAREELSQIDSMRMRESIPSFSDVCSDYCIDFKATGLKDEKRLDQLNAFTKIFGDWSITDVSRIMVENALDDIQEEKSLASPTVNRYQSAISSVFKWAASQRKYREYQLVNPTRDIIRRKESAGRETYLSKEEQARLLAEAKKSKWKGLYLYLYLLLLTGARRTEVIKLRWENIDFNECILTFKDTKNKSDHSLALPKGVIKMLKEWESSIPLSSWVFPYIHDPRRPFMNFDNYWRKCRSNADMPTGLRLHDMRHTTASTMLQDGYSLEEIKHTLNHKSTLMTNRYAHHAKVVQTTASRDFSYTSTQD
ncbi:MAG: tyrosine-type recombinase/integrase [Pseudomonadota bacterium]